MYTRHGMAVQRRGGGGGHAMLTRAGFGDEAGLAHAPRQQGLADSVVDLVRAGVVEILPLQINPRPARLGGQPPGKVQRRGPPDIIPQALAQFPLKGRVVSRFGIGGGQLFQGEHQRLGDEPPAVWPEPPPGVRDLGQPDWPGFQSLHSVAP
jgi:hypothetical protein